MSWLAQLICTSTTHTAMAPLIIWTTMRWRVSVRPMRGGAPAVRALTSVIVPAFARALARRLDPGAEPDVTYSWES